MLTRVKLSRIMDRTKSRCAYCGDPLTLETLTVDHLIPRCAGGTNELANLMACCRDCNTAKGGRPLETLRHVFRLRGTPLRGVISPSQVVSLEALGVVLPIDPPRQFWFEEIAA